MTAHDGFTLRDLVSYNDKHNEANGEDNRDGERDNNSWNCGAEGPTTDPEVIELRHRQIRNLLATLLLSQGVPMLVAGDEFGRTQAGNNNAYCQDNDLSWLNWSLAGEHQELLDFTRRLVRLRQAHPALQRRRFLHGRRVHGADIRDILWLRPDGQKMSDEDWGSGYARTVGMLLDGRAMTEWSESGELVSDDALLCLFNAYWEPIDFSLPEVSNIDHWDVLIDTFRNPSAGPSAAPQCVTCRLQPRSLVVLLGVPPESR